MECGWIGSSGNQLSLVTCRSRRLYDRCRPVLDLCCGDGKSHFLGEDFGLALAAAATVGAFESIVLAGLVETGYLAQNSGFSLDLLMPILQQRGTPALLCVNFGQWLVPRSAKFLFCG